MIQNPFKDIYNSEEYGVIGEFPLIIDIELTNACNLQCSFCSRQIMEREKGFMSEEILKKVIDECAKHRTAIRFIRWGEPFLHPQIIEFCKYVKSKGLPLHITTNGLLLNKELCKGIIDSGVDSIIFSMQGLTKEEYEKERNNNQYDTLRTNIKLLSLMRMGKPYMMITCTTTDSTDPTEFKNYWLQYVDEVEVGRTNYARLNPMVKYNYIVCKEVNRKLSVDWDGKVTACCGDYDNLLTIGDVNKSSLYDIWNGNPKLESIRILLANGCHRSLTLCSKCYPAYGDRI